MQPRQLGLLGEQLCTEPAATPGRLQVSSEMSPAPNSVSEKAIRVYNSQSPSRAFSFRPRAHQFRDKIVGNRCYREVVAGAFPGAETGGWGWGGVPLAHQFQFNTEVRTDTDWNRLGGWKPRRREASHPISACLRGSPNPKRRAGPRNESRTAGSIGRPESSSGTDRRRARGNLGIALLWPFRRRKQFINLKIEKRTQAFGGLLFHLYNLLLG